MTDRLVSPGSAATSAAPGVPAVARRRTPAHPSRSILRELATITLGVLIALSFENFVQWVREFRRNVLAMQSDLMLEEQLARRLIEVYDRVLAATKEK
jgi:hypothetical protein